MHFIFFWQTLFFAQANFTVKIYRALQYWSIKLVFVLINLWKTNQLNTVWKEQKTILISLKRWCCFCVVYIGYNKGFQYANISFYQMSHICLFCCDSTMHPNARFFILGHRRVHVCMWCIIDGARCQQWSKLDYTKRGEACAYIPNEDISARFTRGGLCYTLRPVAISLGKPSSIVAMSTPAIISGTISKHIRAIVDLYTGLIQSAITTHETALHVTPTGYFYCYISDSLLFCLTLFTI